MKFLLVSLSTIIASGSALRGGGGPVDDEPLVPLFPPDASCYEQANTADACEGRPSSDGTGNCIWCQTREDGGGGICLSLTNARDIVEVMGIPCPNYTDPPTREEEYYIVDYVAATTRTTGLLLPNTPPDFNCFHAAWDGENAKVTCRESRAKDDLPCVWCSVGGDDDDGVAGACLSNDEAIAVSGKFGLTCPSMSYLYPAEDVIRGGVPDVNCFKAAWVADDAETACGASKDASGNDCVWCKTSGDVAGVCLSRPESGMANGQFGLTCPGSELMEQVSFERFMKMQQ
jgi:hypothetical protein